MIILDTNIISELMRPIPEPKVEVWLAAQNGIDVYMTAISEAELLRGVELLPKGRRRQSLKTALEAILSEDFAHRILTFDSEAARAFATIAVHRQSIGHPISFPDCLIAAIAQTHSASVATRNVSDFQDCGVEVFDPWRE